VVAVPLASAGRYTTSLCSSTSGLASSRGIGAGITHVGCSVEQDDTSLFMAITSTTATCYSDSRTALLQNAAPTADGGRDGGGNDDGGDNDDGEDGRETVQTPANRNTGCMGRACTSSDEGTCTSGCQVSSDSSVTGCRALLSSANPSWHCSGTLVATSCGNQAEQEAANLIAVCCACYKLSEVGIQDGTCVGANGGMPECTGWPNNMEPAGFPRGTACPTMAGQTRMLQDNSTSTNDNILSLMADLENTEQRDGAHVGWDCG